LGASGQWYTGPSYLVAHLTEAFARPSPIGWPSLLVSMLILPTVVFLLQRTTLEFKVRVALGSLAILGITAAFGIIAEVRTSIPCVALLIACATARIGSYASPMPKAVAKEAGSA